MELRKKTLVEKYTKRKATGHAAKGRLIRMLKTKFLTAREIAARLGCSRVQAYRRIQALRAQGFAFAERTSRERKTGPLARAFRILD